MRERTALIAADTEALALDRAATALATSSANVHLVAMRAGTYQASLRNADAEIEVAIAEDRMTATVAAAGPAIGKASRSPRRA